jgi:Lipid A core - O-antigen ligase and related enzymes
LTKKAKIGWLYLIAALFVALSLFLVVNKNNYYAFALPIVIGALLLFIFSIDKVLLLISFLAPLSLNISDLDIGLALSMPVEPLLFGVMILFIAKFLYDGHYDRKIITHPITIAIFCMFVWMLVTTITSELPIVSVKYFVSRLWFVIPAYFFCILFFKKPKNIDRFVWFYFAGLIIVIVYTIINHAKHGFDGSSAHWVMTPFYNDHTAYGAAIAMYFIFAITYCFMPNIEHKKKVWILGVVLFTGIALALSFCRAAWISIIGALCVLICVLLKIKFRWIVTILVVFVGLFFTFQHQIIDVLERNKQDASADFVENIKSITNISTDASNLERINRWQSAIRLFDERPFFGWGPGTYQFVYAPYQLSKEKTVISTNAGDGGNAHSEYIGALAEMGVFGFLIIVAIVATTVYTGLKVYKRAKNKESKVLVLGATLAFISYFIHGILNNFLDTDKLAIPVWSTMAIIVAIDLYYADKKDFYATDEDKTLPKN